MIVVLLTIPRTGTGFFKGVLSPHFKSITLGDIHNFESALVVTHVGRNAIEYITNVPNLLVITTWRDWNKVKDSFLRHGDTVKTFQEFHEDWELLVSDFDPTILTVEREYLGISREKRLATLGNRLGIDLKTDWEPVNAWEG